MKNVHPCTFFIDEFEAKPQTSLLHETSGIRAASECSHILSVRLSSYGLLSSVHPCTLLNDKFF